MCGPPTPANTWPKLLVVPMASILPCTSTHRTQLAGLIKTEFELWKGHVNDCLSSICQIIGHQSFQFKSLLHPATDKVHCTWAQTSIQQVYHELSLKAQIYHQMRQALESLGLEPELLITTYCILHKDDLKVSAAVGNPNQAGISQTSLSWIWTTIHRPLSADNYLMECMELLPIWCNLWLTSAQFTEFTGSGRELGSIVGWKSLPSQRMKWNGQPGFSLGKLKSGMHM